MDKKAYQYKLTLAGISDPQGEPMTNEPLELIFSNHDDLFRIIEISKGKKFLKIHKKVYSSLLD